MNTKKRIYRLLTVVIALCLMLALAVPSFAAEDSISPYAEVHCNRNGTFGVLLRQSATNNIGYQTTNCAHGRVGRLDARNQYQETVSERCNLCSYQNTYSLPAYWGGWYCI